MFRPSSKFLASTFHKYQVVKAPGIEKRVSQLDVTVKQTGKTLGVIGNTINSWYKRIDWVVVLATGASVLATGASVGVAVYSLSRQERHQELNYLRGELKSEENKFWPNQAKMAELREKIQKWEKTPVGKTDG